MARSAAVRIWMRSPLWRALIWIALLMTVLAAVYTPRPAAVPERIGARFEPLTPKSIIGPFYREVVPIGRRSIPLPPGEWGFVSKVTVKGDPDMLGSNLVRISDGNVTGILTMIGSVAPASMPKSFVHGDNCTRADGYASVRVANPDPNIYECWGIAPFSPASDWTKPNARSVHHQLIDRLREGGLNLPADMVLAEWFQASDRDVFSVIYAFVPPGSLAEEPPAGWGRDAMASDPDKMAFVTAVKEWASSFTLLVEHGVKGALVPADAAAVAARHPL